MGFVRLFILYPCQFSFRIRIYRLLRSVIFRLDDSSALVFYRHELLAFRVRQLRFVHLSAHSAFRRIVRVFDAFIRRFSVYINIFDSAFIIITIFYYRIPASDFYNFSVAINLLITIFFPFFRALRKARHFILFSVSISYLTSIRQFLIPYQVRSTYIFIFDLILTRFVRL